MKYKTLKELCEVISDCPHSTPKWTDHGKIVVRNNNIKNGRIDLSSPSYTDEENFRQRIKRVIPQPGDLIITREAPMGEVGMIPEGIECCLGQRMVLLRANPQECDNYYLLYSIQSREVQHQISWSEGTGTTVSNLRIPHLEQLKIPYLPLKEQEKIVAILKSLDGKIALNNKINDYLEQQAQALYQKYFSETGNAGELADVCNFSKDKIPVSELSIRNYISTENMLSDKKGATEATNLPAVQQTTACHYGNVLISNIRPYFKKILYCQCEGGCSNDVLCFVPKAPELSAYLYCTLYADNFFDFMVAGSKGTKMPRGDKKQIMTYKVCMPSESQLKDFNAAVLPMFQLIENNRGENTKLSLVRDTLLPKLMAGEIDVWNH